MRTIATLPLLLLLAACVAPAQDIPAAPPGTEFVYAPGSAANFTPQQLEQLLAPIALYPDPLIALMLPASTDFPELTAAAQFLATGGTVNQVELQPWDDSARALAHYPQIVRWMVDNPAWTQQLGEAFAAQPDNVMIAIQRLRARARAAGTLIDTPQQVVVYEGDTIIIQPADPDEIYVPYYDPTLVYDRPYSYAPGGYFSYSPAFVTGWWLSFGVDWHRRHVWEVERSERERYWREHRRDWNRPRPPEHRVPPEVHPWRPREGHWPQSGNRPMTDRWRQPGSRDHDRRPDNPTPPPRRGDWRPHDTSPTPGPVNTVADTAPQPTPRSNPSRWPNRSATNPTPSAPPTTQVPAPSASATPTPPPRQPGMHEGWRRDRRGGTVTNPNQPVRVAPTPPPPTPSAALPGYNNVSNPSARPAGPRFPSHPPSAPNPSYTPPPRGGWQHAPAGPPAGQHNVTPPPAQPAPQPTSQPSSPPAGRGDGRHDRNGDHER